MTTVLVVDDQPDIRMLACIVLSTNGFDVEEAPDGATALERLRAADPPDLVLLDLWMPAPDGMAVLDTIRAEELPVKVVMLSAHADHATAALAMDRHADAFVVKPFRPDELVGTLMRVLSAAQ